MNKRFVYNRTSQMITDHLTGYTYHGNMKVCDLLNSVNDKADKNAELYFEVLAMLKGLEMIMKKYEIDTLEKLDRILFEQKVW